MNWLSKFFTKEVEVIIWAGDMKETFVLKKISTITSTQVKGIDAKGKYFEYTSLEPFSYRIQNK